MPRMGEGGELEVVKEREEVENEASNFLSLSIF